MSVATGSLGAAGAEAKSGKIFACYSKKSKVMQHATSTHCKKGSKSISWNKAGVKGPQGPQGAAGAPGARGPQGAQGAPGAVAGYTGGFLTGSKGSSSPAAIGLDSHGAIVASFTPGTAANYAVNGTAALLASKDEVVCFEANLVTLSHGVPGTSGELANHNGTIATTGILHGGPGSPILEICGASGSGHARVSAAAVTGVQLATANGHASRSALHSKTGTIANVFKQIPHHSYHK